MFIPALVAAETPGRDTYRASAQGIKHDSCVFRCIKNKKGLQFAFRLWKLWGTIFKSIPPEKRRQKSLIMRRVFNVILCGDIVGI